MVVLFLFCDADIVLLTVFVASPKTARVGCGGIDNVDASRSSPRSSPLLEIFSS